MMLIIAASNGVVGNDEGIWSYIGRVWNRNDILPYVGTIENKTPAIFYLHRLSDALFGVNDFFVRALAILSIIIGAFTIHKIGKMVFNEFTGIIGMCIYGLMNAWKMLDGPYVGQTESFMTMFTISAFYFTIKFRIKVPKNIWLIIAGAAIGMAILFKQIALISLLALLCIHIYTSKGNSKIIGAMYILSGTLIVGVVSSMILISSGVTFQSYFEGAWLILFESGSSRILNQDYFDGFSSIWLNSRIVIVYPILLLLFLQKELLKHKYFRWILVWFFFDLVAANLSGYFYGHQLKQMLPALSLILAALLVNEMKNIIGIDFDKIKDRYFRFGLLFVFIVFVPYRTLYINSKRLIIENDIDHNQKVAAWLYENTDEDDFIYALGGDCNPILALSERVSSSEYFNSIFISGEEEQTEILKDLAINPPTYIIKDESTTELRLVYGDEFVVYLTQNFKLFHTESNIEIFKRKGL